MMSFVFAQTEGGDSAASAIGWAIFAILLIGFALGVFLNARKGRAEVGA